MTLVQGDPGSDDPDGFDPIPVMDDDMPSKSLMSCHSFGKDDDAAAAAAEDVCCCLEEPDDDGTQSPLLSAATLAAAAAMAPWTAAEAVAMATTVVAIYVK